MSGPPAHQQELRFEPIERLGAGGMAVVWRALDRKLRREVALKELREEVAVASEGLARFRHEAEAIARLSHPNVVAFHDAVEEGARTLLVLELVRGEPLDRLLAKQPPLRRTVEILEKVARGVHHAHEQGVIHRDLKPSNVLVAEDGEPKVSDFGLAHLSGDMVTTLTKTGAILGTPAYMAPEQARGDRHAIDRRTDVYALGAILYEALAGAPPFRADSVHALVHEIVNEEPVEPRAIRSDVPLDLQTIALKCLAKESDRRYATALDVAEELRRWLDGQPIVARPPSPTELVALWVRRNRTLSALAALLVLALAGAGAAWGLRVRETLARERAAAREIAAVRAGSAHDGAIDRIIALDSETTVALLEEALAQATDELGAAARTVFGSANQLTPEEQRAGSKPFAELDRILDVVFDSGEVTGHDKAVLDAAIARIEDRATRAAPSSADSHAADIRTLVAAAQRAKVPDGERAVAAFACEALGRLKRARSVKVVARYLAMTFDERDALVAGDALAKIGGPEAGEALLLASRRYGTSGLFWTRVSGKVGTASVFSGDGEPRSAEEYRKRGVAKASAHDLDGAIADLTSAIALDAKDAFAWYNRACARFERRDLDGALADASRAVKLKPEDGGFLGLRGNIRRARGDLKGALKDVERACELDPARPVNWTWLGQVRLAAGDPARAIAALTSALALEPGNLVALNSRGTARKRSGDTKGAFEDWSHAIELDDRFAAGYANRGGLYYETGQFDRALADLDHALELTPHNPEALANRGRTRAKKGDLDGALDDLDRLVKIAPRYGPGWWLRGQVKKDRRDYEGAEADFEHAHRLMPKQAAILNDLGSVERLSGDLDAALATYERALAIDARVPQIWQNRALVRGLKGDTKGQLEDATKAIELDESYAEAWFTRAAARAHTGDKAGALADADRAVDLAPEKGDVWTSRAYVKRILGDDAGAIEDATRALDLEPRNIEALANRGHARAKTGDKAGAIADLERYVALAPVGSFSEAARAEIERLRK